MKILPQLQISKIPNNLPHNYLKNKPIIGEKKTNYQSVEKVASQKNFSLLFPLKTQECLTMLC